MALTPTQKKLVRAHMARYCQNAEANQRRWHYSQQRPFRYVDNPNSSNVVADCSGYVSIVYHDAMHDTGIFLADPLGYRYTGYGYTGSQLDWLKDNGRRVPLDKTFFVGDMVIYGDSEWRTVHTSICRKNGTRKTAIFSSNGNENAPQPTNIDYHPDPIIGVWRHPALV